MHRKNTPSSRRRQTAANSAGAAMPAAGAQADIGRRIADRFAEEHPFRRASPGMDDFAELVPLLPLCGDAEFAAHISELERLFKHIRNCVACRGKLCMFLSVFLMRRQPERSRLWRIRARKAGFLPPALFLRPSAGKPRDEQDVIMQALEADMRSRQAPRRDYVAEVLDFLAQKGVAP